MKWPWQMYKELKSENIDLAERLSSLELDAKRDLDRFNNGVLVSEYDLVSSYYSGHSWSYQSPNKYVFGSGRTEYYENSSKAIIGERGRIAIIAEYIKSKEEKKNEL